MSDLYICAIDHDAGSSIVTLGLYGALSRKVGKLGFLKPVGGNHGDHDVAVMKYAFGIKEDSGTLCPFCIKNARQQVAQEAEDDMLDVIDRTYREISAQSDITLLQGISSLRPPNAFDININEAIASRLKVPVLLVARAIPENGVTDITQVIAGARTAIRSYENAGAKVVGVVVNRVVDQPAEIAFQRLEDGFARAGIPYWGALPELKPLSCPRIDPDRRTARSRSRVRPGIHGQPRFPYGSWRPWNPETSSNAWMKIAPSSSPPATAKKSSSPSVVHNCHNITIPSPAWSSPEAYARTTR